MATQPTREQSAQPGPEHISEADLEVVAGPNGPAMAAILAAGLGVFFLGFLTTLNEMAVGVHDWLIFQERVGPLSGKTTMAGVGWLVVWAVLGVLWWKRDLPILAVAAATLLLVVIGNLLMFPPIFQATA